VSERNKEVIRRALLEAWGGGNLDVLDELVAEDYVGHEGSQPEPVRGRAALKALMASFREAIPDLTYEIEDQLAEGEKVATKWRGSGTQSGELLGVPATGRRVSFGGISIERVVDGRVVEDWSYWDVAGLMRQLGAAP
jgi:steroid delta-isomerase-like uncharacterized protein